MFNLMIFIFFALLDASMAGLCSYFYSGKEKYAEGMILGVHVPPDAGTDEAVMSLTAKYKTGFQRSRNLNLAAGIILPAACFLSMGIFLPLWTLWCLEFCAFYLFYPMSYHRKMYSLKLERQWFQDAPGSGAAADTRVSALSGRFPLSWKWHLPALAAGIGLWLFPAVRRAVTGTAPGMVFAPVCGLLPAVFLLLHLCLSGQRNRVFSLDSAINEKISRIQKRTWTGALIAADYAALAAGLYICIRLLTGRELHFWDYIIYCTIDLLGAAAVITAAVLIRQRRRDVLSQDMHPLITDDDVYWKNGWYYNPGDRHLFVEDRMCSTSYAINMAHPAAKWWVGAAAVICAAAVAGILIASVILTGLDFSDTELTVRGNDVTVSYSFYSCTFSLEDVQSAELLDELPDDSFARDNGGDTERLLVGHFTGEKTGKTMMFLLKEETPLIRISLPGQTVFLNSDAEGQTEEWYRFLEKNCPRV